jgi:hypothetical protein
MAGSSPRDVEQPPAGIVSITVLSIKPMKLGKIFPLEAVGAESDWYWYRVRSWKRVMIRVPNPINPTKAKHARAVVITRIPGIGAEVLLAGVHDRARGHRGLPPAIGRKPRPLRPSAALIADARAEAAE